MPDDRRNEYRGKNPRSRGTHPRDTQAGTGSKGPGGYSRPSQYDQMPAKPLAPPEVRSTARQQMYDCFASCPKGLEELLFEELQGLGAMDMHKASGGCSFKAGWPLATRITYWTRFAGRIGLRVAHGPCYNEEDLYRLGLSVDWWNWFGLTQTFRVDLTTLGANFQNPRFAQLRLKDAVCDGFMNKLQQRPDISVPEPDVRIFAAATPSEASIYMDLAGENLFKRGWRIEKGEAPLKENLAAGVWAMARRSPAAQGIDQFLDPFCGSGTLVIEALSVLCDRAPGLDRPFSFEKLKPYDEALGKALQNDANTRFNAGLDRALNEQHFTWKGSDITQLLVDIAKENLCRAGFEELLEAGIVTFSQRDAVTTEPWAEQGLIITNPPYGERVRAKGADIPDEDEAYQRLFKEYGDVLKKRFAGWTAFLLSGDLEVKKTIGLSPKRKTPLFNGAIECRLFEFPLAAGVYRPRSTGEDTSEAPSPLLSDSDNPDIATDNN